MIAADLSPLLTIAVPTYQRKQWVQESVRRVLEQMQGVDRGRVEIVISENAGADGTWEWAQSLAATAPGLRLHRNERNLGAEGNVRGLPGLARGRYVWMLGDDDYLRPGALARVLALLEQDCDYIALNFAPSDEHHQREGKPNWVIGADLQVGSLHACCAVVPHFALGFLSSWVVRRDLLNTTTDAEYDHFKQWGLSVMVDRYRTVALGRRGVVMAETALTTRKPPTAEYPATFDYFGWFFEGSALVLEHLQRQGILDARTASERRAWLLQTVAVKRILYERSAGVIRRENVARILHQHYRRQWQYWLLCIPGLYLPGLGRLAAAARRLYAAAA